MSPPAHPSRRDVLRSTAVAALCGSLPAPAHASPPDARATLALGFTSYSTRKLTLEQTIAVARRLGVAHVSLKDFHAPLDASGEQRREVAQKVRDAGLALVGCGVITMANDRAQIRSRFEYARDLGTPLIIASPDPAALDVVDEMVREFGIRVAIHNHGPEDRWYPTPDAARRAIEGRDPRIGLCIDVGHAARAGVDPAAAVRAHAARLLDVHMKDLARTGTQNEVIELGHGVLDLAAVLRALVDVKFAGHVALEHEKDEDDPLPGMAESIGYLRGVLRML